MLNSYFNSITLFGSTEWTWQLSADFISWAPSSSEQNKNHKGFIPHLCSYLTTSVTVGYAYFSPAGISLPYALNQLERAVGCRLRGVLGPVKHPKTFSPVEHRAFDSSLDPCILLLLTGAGSIPHYSNEEQIFKADNFGKLISACEPLHLIWPKPKTAYKIHW